MAKDLTRPECRAYLGYCKEMRREYKRGVRDKDPYSRRHSLYRVAQYDWVIARIKAGAPFDAVCALNFAPVRISDCDTTCFPPG